MSNQKENEKNNLIQDLREEIHYLQEYLYSDICKACGNAALKLEEKIKELEILVSDHERLG